MHFGLGAFFIFLSLSISFIWVAIKHRQQLYDRTIEPERRLFQSNLQAVMCCALAVFNLHLLFVGLKFAESSFQNPERRGSTLKAIDRPPEEKAYRDKDSKDLNELVKACAPRLEPLLIGCPRQPLA